MTNDEVLKIMNKRSEINVTIKTGKLEYLGHIMRNERRDGLLQLILQGKIPGQGTRQKAHLLAQELKNMVLDGNNGPFSSSRQQNTGCHVSR